MFPIPKSVFLTRGIDIHRRLLTSFEYTLRAADIEQQNPVIVSSIRNQASANNTTSEQAQGGRMLAPGLDFRGICDAEYFIGAHWR